MGITVPTVPLVNPSNRLVTPTLEGEWNVNLRALAQERDEREDAGNNRADWS